MATRIVLLPAALADQIAAGEVVERPASVVKELVENALDAGARRVEVEIERGGLGRILVTDDGDGMSPEEAHLALRRHATSKLRTAEELFALATFGFRGEALPSIASIAELTLTTRRLEDTAGYAIVVRGGEVVSAEEVGAPSGTRIEARALFSNVPARLKFQKAVSTEAGHVVESLVRTALGAHGVHVRLRVDGRGVLELPSHPSLAERAHAVLRRAAGRVVKLASATATEGAIVVEVHLAPPEESVQTARRVHLLVNRRVVRDRGLLSALSVALADHLPRGRHPLAVVSVTLPPADVDVNVHPQKLEVRLARGAEVYAAVRHAVRRAVSDAAWTLEAPAEKIVIPDTRYAVERPAPPLVARESLGIFDFAAARPPAAARDEDEHDDVEHGDSRGHAFELVSAIAEGQPPFVPPQPEPSTPRYLGPVAGGYLSFADASGLWLVDQHVASALCLAAAPPEPVTLERALHASAALIEHAPPSLRFRDGRLVAAPASVDAMLLAELERALVESGPEEMHERLLSHLALSTADHVGPETAEALFSTLQGGGPPVLLLQLRFRGRRAAVFVGRAELGRRFDS